MIHQPEKHIILFHVAQPWKGIVHENPSGSFEKQKISSFPHFLNLLFEKVALLPASKLQVQIDSSFYRVLNSSSKE